MATVALSVAFATPAWAHAVLVETDPVDDARLVDPPNTVRLLFNEPVDVPLGAVRVFDSSGERVDRGDATHGTGPEEVRVSLSDLAEGVYVVTWRAVSADSHPVSGAFLFHVGDDPAEIDEALFEALLGDSGDVPFAVAGWLLRWLAYAGGLIAVGGVVFALVVARRSVPQVVNLVRWAALVGIIGSLLQVPVFAAEATGLGWSALVSIPAMETALGSSLALAAVIRVAALATIAVTVGRTSPWWPTAGVVGVVVAELATGHTRTSEPVWLVTGADAVHVLAVAVWFGGLAALAVTMRAARADDDVVWGARLIGRFSTVATWTLLAVAIGGLGLAWALVRTPQALTSTTYGWTLVAKVALIIPVLMAARYNNRILVPAVTGEKDALSPTGAWNRLNRTVRFELVGLLAVVGITAMLVNIQPAAEVSGVSGPYSTHVPLGDLELHLVVDPNRVGTNEVHLFLLNPGGFAVLATGPVEIEFSLPDQDIGPIARTPEPAGVGHYLHVGSELAIPGDWVITVRHRVDDFEEVATDVAVTVNP